MTKTGFGLSAAEQGRHRGRGKNPVGGVHPLVRFQISRTFPIRVRVVEVQRHPRTRRDAVELVAGVQRTGQANRGVIWVGQDRPFEHRQILFPFWRGVFGVSDNVGQGAPDSAAQRADRVFGLQDANACV
jgi:hypothetical protein